MSEINITMFWDMTPCSLVNMNTDISAKPADWLFRKETKAAGFSVTSVAKVSRPTLLILIFTSEGTWNLFLPLRLNKETVNNDNTVVF